MLHKYLKLLVLMILVLSDWANAEIFFWNDEQGRTYYSDKGRDGAVSVRIRPVGETYYRVKKVYDGDTILLDNRIKIRFLGINTPEVESGRKEGEVGGREAKEWLEKLLTGKKVRLETDLDKKDKYGRTLAHLFTEDKRHINLELVKKGLAVVSIHPPNLKYTDQLLKTQQQAEDKKLGIWGYDEYESKEISNLLQGRSKGWQRLTGRVISIKEGRKFSYLEFTGNIDARIEHNNLYLFPPLQEYVGKQIEIRGWTSRRRKHYSVLIRHPSAIRIHR